MTIEAPIEIDKGITAPELPLQLVPRDDFPRTDEQEPQNLEGLVLNFDAYALLAQFTPLQIGDPYTMVRLVSR